MRHPLPTVVDATLAAQPAVCVSAGRRGLQLELAGSDLVALCHATVAAIGR
jgi:Cys-tRNA(Pro)/Cys-tRNA(Cys) deacylase